MNNQPQKVSITEAKRKYDKCTFCHAIITESKKDYVWTFTNYLGNKHVSHTRSQARLMTYTNN